MMNQEKRITIIDIAMELNLSPSTVSRALNDRWDVSPETRRKVLEKAEELNYKPNVLSLGLKGFKTFTVGVIIPELENSFFAEVLNGINSVLQNHDYQILICQSNEDSEQERNNIRLLESRFVDGYLVSASNSEANAGYFKALVDKGYPLVFFNRICPKTQVPSVVVDDRKYAFLATDHLIKQGCRRIAHFMGPVNITVSQDRKLGYMDALEQNNIPFEEELVIPAGIFMEDGITAAKAMLARGGTLPDGIFAVNDPCAIGAIKALKEAHISIPDDIAVVGFSESPMATIVDPELTSVKQPTLEIGASAARLLLEWMQTGRMPKTRQLKLDASLNIRKSSLKLV